MDYKKLLKEVESLKKHVYDSLSGTEGSKNTIAMEENKVQALQQIDKIKAWLKKEIKTSKISNPQ